MKLLFLHGLADPKFGGGAEITLWTLMRALRDAGHECVLLATSNKRGLCRDTQDGVVVWKAGIRNVYWPHHKKRPSAPLRLLWHALDSYNPWMQGYLRDIVAQERPDLVSLHNLPGWSVASWRTLPRLGVPAVQVLHDYYAICVKATMLKNNRNCPGQCIECRAFRLPHRALSGRVQAVVGVSRFILERHRSLGYFHDVPIQCVIHNARAPLALGTAGKPLSRPHQGVRFGYIGRLDEPKGIAPLMDAFRSADIRDSELWIAGSGKQHYEAYLHNRAADERIRFLGRVAPRDFYPQVDVVVVPSLWNDNLPGVVFEALAFGKPVIGSRRGGIPEMVRDHENGLLFEPSAPAELAKTLQLIADDHALRNRLTGAAQPSARRFTDINSWVSTYEALYGKVLDSFAPRKHSSST